jgi:hypothetical protein
MHINIKGNRKRSEIAKIYEEIFAQQKLLKEGGIQTGILLIPA